MRVVKAPGYRILVRMKTIDKDKEVKSKSGLILELKSEKDLELEQQGSVEGYVVDIGPMAFKESPTPWCTVGDCIQIYKHSGALLPDLGDGYTYRMVQDLDVQAVFPEESINL